MQARSRDVASTITVLLLLAASLFPLWVAWHQQQKFLNDDTYITLTYAKSLAHGRGFVFNHPPPTPGTTSPLLTLLVAGLAMALPRAEIPTIAVFLTALCWIGIAWVLFAFRRGLGLTEWQAALIGGMVFAYGGVNLLGMEAYLFAFLLVLSVALFHSGRWVWTGIATGLLSLARGEGVLMLPVLVTYSRITRWNAERRLSFQALRPAAYLVAGFALPATVWLAYAHVTFGSFFPSTLAAKVAQGRTGLWPSFTERLLSQWLPRWGVPLALDGLPFLSLWWLLVLLGVAYAATRKRQWLVFLAWMVLYTVGYAALGVPGYWWYQFPIVFVLQILAGLGLAVGVEMLLAREQLPWLGRGIAVGLVVLAVSLLGRRTVNIALYDPGDPRAGSYLRLSQWIRENTQPSESVAYFEIGYLGYFTDNRIVDLAGLTTPALISHIAEGDFAWGFWHYRPDYYIYLPDFDWALTEIRASPEFAREYRPVARLPGPRETDFVIYRRVSPGES